MITRIRFYAFIMMLWTANALHAQTYHDRLPLIPAPDSVREMAGQFVITPQTMIVVSDDSLRPEAFLLNALFQKMYGFSLTIVKGEKPNAGSLFLASGLASGKIPGAYQLKVTKNHVFIKGDAAVGVFYAVQTLGQLLPAGKSNSITVPCVEIMDAPRFSWRGMHLDVSRHFFSVEFVKRYLDHLARYKMNYFHWHLTDDQGWRIEIKRYPKLQSVSAWRNGTRIGHYSEQPERYDSIRYGGFYTQEEIRSVVEYAAKLHITVVPEIEMPGHALAALAAYPELSCTGGPFEVGRTWGVFQDVFCPKEETFEFLENVLTEVCALFPGPYVHVGGDECPKDRWKECARCQSLIKKEGLKDEHELQSWFVQRIGRFLQTKNKKLIGWDEILEGGLAPDATVMSWRGYSGGNEAARQKHDVVMTPTGYCYFDYFQSRNSSEPLAIGGYLPLERVYAFEPVSAELSAEDARYIIGAQANLWTEYITSEEKVEYMLLPRLCALSEVVWSETGSRNYSRFISRLTAHFKLLDYLGINYSKAVFDVQSEVMPNNGRGVSVSLSSPYKLGMIRYTLDGVDPDHSSPVYAAPILSDQSLWIKAAVFDGFTRKGTILEQVYRCNLATGKEIVLANKPDEEYCRGGGFTLVNGLTGSLPWNGADWLGFRGTDLVAVIDLGQAMSISRVALDVLRDEGSWIHYPRRVEVLVSDNGSDFTSVYSLSKEYLDPANRLVKMKFDRVKTRYVKVVAENAGSIPDGMPGAGNPAWLFVDEISVE